MTRSIGGRSDAMTLRCAPGCESSLRRGKRVKERCEERKREIDRWEFRNGAGRVRMTASKDSRERTFGLLRFGGPSERPALACRQGSPKLPLLQRSQGSVLSSELSKRRTYSRGSNSRSRHRLLVFLRRRWNSSLHGSSKPHRSCNTARRVPTGHLACHL